MTEERIKEFKKKFRVLADWKITIGSGHRIDGTPYTGECTHNQEKQTAVIYPWHENEQEPENYLLHEMFHIAFVAARGDYEKEELLCQDLCTVAAEAREEGLEEGVDAGMAIVNDLWGEAEGYIGLTDRDWEDAKKKAIEEAERLKEKGK